MELLKFKTTINDEAGVNKVAPHLEKIENVSRWNVDTNSEEHILSISGENLNVQFVKNAVEEAGFQAEVLRVVGLGGGDL